MVTYGWIMTNHMNTGKLKSIFQKNPVKRKRKKNKVVNMGLCQN